MGNYENAVQFAGECDKQMNILKKQREEQERQEKARIEAREAAELAETERRNRREEEQKRRKQRAKRIIGLMLTFVPFITNLLLYYISSNEIMFTCGFIFFSIVLQGIPLIRIHFRDEIRIPSIVIYIIGFLLQLLTFQMIKEKILEPPYPYLGSLALAVAFIMACAYPKEKYWD